MKKTTSTRKPGLERLERAIAHQGIASRREAKALIKAGSVRVNNTIIREPGFGVDMVKDKITIKSIKLETRQSVLVYKPRGVETSATTRGAKDARAVFPGFAHLNPIGRLDKESEGLLIMSNDGTLASALTREGTSIGKTYLVTVREQVSADALKKMANGIKLDDKMTKPAETYRAGRTSFTITLHEGRKHQIRRMCDACKLTIVSLVRTKIGPIDIGTLKAGTTRFLTDEEIDLLKGN